MSQTEELYLIADELRAIANMGLHRTEDVHDRDRYEKILSISAPFQNSTTSHN
jgi:hypothetical protein